MASARIPFRSKVAAVWVVIFILLGLFCIAAGFDREWIKDNIKFIAGGLKWTIIMAIGGIVLAIVLATFGALARVSRNPISYGIAGFYVSFFRGTPLIVQMFLIYLALPPVGQNLTERYSWLPSPGTQDLLTLSSIEAGVLALGLNYGAYMTEIFRAGIQSVAGGQGEAADALGMTHGQKMRKVILPQAFRVIIPPTGNEFIAMMKDTALVSFLGSTLATMEIFRRAQLVGKADFKNLEAYLAAALLYWMLTAIFSFFQRRLEIRVGRGYVRTSSVKDAVSSAAAAAAVVRRRHRMSERDVVVKVDGLHKSFGRLEVVKGVDMEVWRGRGGRDLRPQRIGQVHVAAVRELPRGPDTRQHRGRRRSGCRAVIERGASGRRSASCGCNVGMVFQQFNLFPQHDCAGQRDRPAPVRVDAARRRPAGRARPGDAGAGRA